MVIIADIFSGKSIKRFFYIFLNVQGFFRSKDQRQETNKPLIELQISKRTEENDICGTVSRKELRKYRNFYVTLSLDCGDSISHFSSRDNFDKTLCSKFLGTFKKHSSAK